MERREELSSNEDDDRPRNRHARNQNRDLCLIDRGKARSVVMYRHGLRDSSSTVLGIHQATAFLSVSLIPGD